MRFYKSRDIHAKNEFVKPIIVNGDEIELVESFKYLGVYLDSTLSYNDHYCFVQPTLTLRGGVGTGETTNRS